MRAAFPLESSITETRSHRGTLWRLRPACDSETALIRQRLDVSDLVARLLVARGIGVEDAEGFLTPRLRDALPDPRSLKDMDKASSRLARACIEGETLAIFGDYDVDGATSAALLFEVLRMLGAQPRVYIPDRMQEGYGPNAPALLKLGAEGARLIVTVDCGTVAYAPLEAAAEAGIEVIVVDHHQGEPALPRAYAVVNPNRADEAANPCQQLAAVGVAFLLLIAIIGELRRAGHFAQRAEPNLLAWLDIVALGTVCDVMPLTGLNRALVSQGLKQLGTRSRLGLRVLGDVAGLSDTPTAYHLGFIFGPRINAGGRVGRSDLGVRLLTATDESEALHLAQALNRHNAERKSLEAEALAEAMAQAEAKMMADPDLPLLLLHAEGWHPGVIGIVAGRLKERFGVPTMIVAREGGIGKASCRSIGGVDLGAAIAAAKGAGHLIGGGGHSMAAGFSAYDHALPALEAFLHHRLREPVAAARAGSCLWLDGRIALSGITQALGEEIARLAPYGQGHPAPRWWIDNARVLHAEPLNGQHIRLTLGDGSLGGSNVRVKAMAFRIAEEPLGQWLLSKRGQSIQCAATLQLNHWQGRTSAELIVEDAAEA